MPASATDKTVIENAKTAAQSATSAAQSAAEPFAAAGTKALRETMEKSMLAMSEINSQSRKNLDAVVASATAAARGAETVGARALAYSKKSVEDNVAAAKSISGAKSLQEVFELQTAFAKTAFAGYVAESGAMAETFTASLKETFLPINERVTALVERVQSAR